MSEPRWKQKRDSVREPGMYKAMVIVADKDKSKKGNPMLIVVFQTQVGCVRGFFVPGSSAGNERLLQLKDALGLPYEAVAEDMEGKKCVVVCKLGEPKTNEHGKTVRYIELEGVLPAGTPVPEVQAKPKEESVPF